MPFSPLQALARLRIGTRLALRSVLVLLLISTAGLVQLGRLNQLSVALHELASQRLTLLHLAEDISAGAHKTSRKLLVLISASREQRVAAYRDADAANRQIDQDMGRLGQQLNPGPSQAAYAELVHGLALYRETYGRNVDLIEAEDLAAARAMMARETERALDQLALAADHLLDIQQQETAQHAQELQDEIRHDRQWLLVIGAGVVLLSGLLDGVVRRSITWPPATTAPAPNCGAMTR